MRIIFSDCPRVAHTEATGSGRGRTSVQLPDILPQPRYQRGVDVHLFLSASSCMLQANFLLRTHLQPSALGLSACLTAPVSSKNDLLFPDSDPHEDVPGSWMEPVASDSVVASDRTPGSLVVGDESARGTEETLIFAAGRPPFHDLDAVGTSKNIGVSSVSSHTADAYSRISANGGKEMLSVGGGSSETTTTRRNNCPPLSCRLPDP